jgi:hypothetical protein
MNRVAGLVAVFVVILSLGVTPVMHAAGAGAESSAAADFAVPPDKAEQWQNIRNRVDKEFDICSEHCGSDRACLDRCEKVHQVRLEREYKSLMNK